MAIITLEKWLTSGLRKLRKFIAVEKNILNITAQKLKSENETLPNDATDLSNDISLSNDSITDDYLWQANKHTERPIMQVLPSEI